MSGNLYRVGRKLGRTLYLQRGPEPADDDELLGILDDPGFAAFIADLLSENEFQYFHDTGQPAPDREPFAWLADTAPERSEDAP